jgi:hypothetical protein
MAAVVVRPALLGFRPKARQSPPRTGPRAAAAFPRWTSVVEYLDDAGVHSLSADSVEHLVEAGWLLVDVRPMEGKEYAVINAAEVPIFEAMTRTGVSRRAVNARFVEEVTAAAGGRNVVIMCENGGSLDPATFEPSRSIFAAWTLRTAWDAQGRGSQKIAHLIGGTRSWSRK